MGNEERPTKIWEQYQKGLEYFDKMGLRKMWNTCEDFIEGRQWPEPTKRTKNLPRPVINLCSMICENKKASILSSNIKLLYRPSELADDEIEKAEQGANIFTKFSDSIQKEICQKDLDDLAQDYATQLGTYVYHYYWDTTIVGGMKTPYVGGVRAEVLHPRNVIVANPMELDEQKQEYIIVVSQEPLESVIALAKRNKIQNYESIRANYENNDGCKETGIDYCIVLTRYSRIKGKVVWEKSTENVIIQPLTYWEPNKEKIKIDETEDFSEVNEPDTLDFNLYFKKQMYPIVFGQHKSRKKSIYGIGEVEQIIPNQKAINFNLAMMLLSVQQTAWPKIIQKVGSLASQTITNAPGEILTDYSKGQNWGAKFMDTPTFNPQALQLTNTIMDLTRTTTGSSEVTTGEVMGANMAASAIIALQNQAKKPIEQFQNKFYRVYEKIGQILLQFYKYYYNDSRLFSYEENGQRYISEINGSLYQNIDFSLSVEVGAGGAFSESLIVSLLDKLKADGDINSDQYIELYPESIMVFKDKLKKMREQAVQLEVINNLPVNGMIPNQNGQEIITK